MCRDLGINYREMDMGEPSVKRNLEKQSLADQLHNNDVSLMKRYCLKVTGRNSLLRL